MRRTYLRAFPFVLAIALAFAPTASAQYGVTAPVQGVILDARTGMGAPGLLVSLIHPVLGRSAPSYTDFYGNFGWVAIPVRSESYYMEVYWGNSLLYRQPIDVQGPVMLAPLRF